METPRSLYLRCSSLSPGMAMRQGGHQVAQKSTTRTVPSNCLRSTFPLPKALGREKSRVTTGASSPAAPAAADGREEERDSFAPADVVDPEEQPRPASASAAVRVSSAPSGKYRSRRIFIVVSRPHS